MDTSSEDGRRLERFERQVEDVRTLLKIPGMSAVITRDRRVLWAGGFGFADLENRVPAAPDTLYHVASLTKTFGATLIMQLVEQGKVELDEPASRYSSNFRDDAVEIRHLLSHTSQEPPGERYEYDGYNYDYLTEVIEKTTGKSFRETMVQTFLDPLAMSDSVPGHDVVDDADRWAAALGKENLDRYSDNLLRLAQPYTLYGDNEIVHVPYPPKGLGAAAGLLSTVLDMAKYDTAIDGHLFLKKETQEEAWTAFVSNNGERLPHGLGWFVSDYHGTRLIWHFGHWGAGFSAIYLKAPDKNLSLVMLANSEALSDHQFQGGGDITDNVFACTFLRLFVSEVAQGHRLPDPEWRQGQEKFSGEITRFSKQSGGYGYDCERSSHAALVKWAEARRMNARVAIQVDPETLDAYVGRYQADWSPDRIIIVSREGDKLFVNVPADHLTEMYASSESEFFLKVRSLRMTFIKLEGQVTHLEFEDNGQTARATRIP